MKTGYEKGHAKKAVILSTCLVLIVNEGLHEVTLKNLHQRSKISKSLISYYYPDLNEIFVELGIDLATKGQKMTEEALFGVTGIEAKLNAMILAAFKWCTMDPNIGKFFLLMFHLSSINPKIHKMIQTILLTGQKRIEGFLLEKYSKKNAEQLSWPIHNIMVGGVTRMITLNEFNNYEEYLKRIEESIKFQLTAKNH
jgi:AcrR family transcriptional regulator